MHAKSKKGRGFASSTTGAVAQPAAVSVVGSDPAITVSAAFKSALGAGGNKPHLPALADTHAKLSKKALRADRPDKPIQTRPARNLVSGPRQGHK